MEVGSLKNVKRHVKEVHSAFLSLYCNSSFGRKVSNRLHITDVHPDLPQHAVVHFKPQVFDPKAVAKNPKMFQGSQNVSRLMGIPPLRPNLINQQSGSGTRILPYNTPPRHIDRVMSNNVQTWEKTWEETWEQNSSSSSRVSGDSTASHSSVNKWWSSLGHDTVAPQTHTYTRIFAEYKTLCYYINTVHQKIKI